MDSHQTSTAPASSTKPRRNQPRAIRYGVFLGAVLIVGGIVGWIVWWEQDRPLREIEAALKAGDKPKALLLVGRYLAEHPQDARAMSLRGRILVESGRLPEAIQLFRRNGALDIADLRAWAKAHLLRQEWSDAVPILERILQLNPNEADSLHELTACRSYLGEFRRALESAQKLATLPNQSHRAWLQIGTLHQQMSNTRSAIEAWDKVLKVSPNGEDLQVPAEEFLAEFGRVLLDDGQVERARSLVDMSLAKRVTPDGLQLLGNIHLLTGNEKEAVSAWTRCVEQAPLRREPREALANIAMNTGQSDEARKWLEPVISGGQINSSTAYLMQRICSIAKDDEGAKHWQSRTTALRERERLVATVDRVLIESPESFWSGVIRAYRFAENGNWTQAETQLAPLTKNGVKEEFVKNVLAAVKTRNRAALPPLEQLPITQH